MQEWFDTPAGRYYYGRCLGIVEPVFAHLRHARGSAQLTLRGRVKVDIQWKLYCMVHSLATLVPIGPRFA